ncbi:MAG: ATP-binding protein [Deltaproteobacteria bacterium]|nr:ATP-binding protein [Deltaproteobacteria bacterium]
MDPTRTKNGKNVEKQDGIRLYGSREERPFLQPIALAIVCAVFIGLILIMGILDINRIDRTLLGLMETRGLEITGVVQNLTEETLKVMSQVRQEGDSAFAPLAEEADSPQKTLLAALVALGRQVDDEWKADHLSETYLRKFAEEKNLWLVVVLNKKGQVVFQSRSLPADLVAGQGAEGKRQITLDLFAQLGRMKKIGFIALRRRDGSGTVVIALDRNGLRYWGTRVSVTKAIEKLGEERGPIYLVIMDRKGMVLGSAGQVPVKWRENDIHTAEILAGTRPIESRKVLYQGEKVLDIAAPFYLNDQIAGIARVGLNRSEADQILKENERYMFVFMAVVVLIALLSMWLLYHNQNRHLAGILDMERQLDKAERLSALGQLAAGVAHEIRNPLNAVSMASQRLKREFMPADPGKSREFQTLTGVIRDEIRRLDGIIEEFLTFSKSRRLDLQDYPVTEVLQKIVNLVREEAAARGISIQTHWNDNAAVIPMDMDKLQQALLNFVKNAMESMTDSGSLIISVEPAEKNRLGIKIADTGCGMTPDEIERIFSPEYTTKEKGLGLGLPLAHEIVRGHGGVIRVESRPGAGTTFEILLPRERGKDRKGQKPEGISP